MTKRERNLLIFLSLVVIIFVYYYFFFQNQLDETIILDDEIANQEIQLKTYETSKTSIKNLSSQKESIEEDLYEGLVNYLGDIEQEEVILLINEIILRSKVQVASLSFERYAPNQFEAIDYDVLGVTISVAGDYVDVTNFMSSFLRFDQNIYISELSLNGIEDDISGTIKVAFVKMNNKYASNVALFQWYEDNFYIKDNPFASEDFSNIFKPNYFYTGTDVEFYNPPYESFSDIDGHYAEEVINFFGRNGYIVGDEDNNVYPDQHMTRLETVILLDLVFRWELADTVIDLETFDDFGLIETLSDLEKKTLLKAYNSGYLFGYEDNTLRPNNLITYSELGYIGANILDDKVITWKEVAEELEETLGYRSNGLVDEGLFATKAEIIYFLSYIDQKIIE